MDTLANRLRSLRREKAFTQTELGQYLGVGKTTISNYETGYSTPDIEMLINIANLYNVSIDYLLGRVTYLKEENEENYKSTHKIPLFKSINSKDIDADENIIEDYVAPPYFRNTSLYVHGSVFALISGDDNLSGINILKGDMLYITTEFELENGDFVLVHSESCGTVVRKYYDISGTINLLAINQNADFQPIIFQKQDKANYIIGKVIKATIAVK